MLDRALTCAFNRFAALCALLAMSAVEHAAVHLR
jgi:hypothetical protein